MDKPCTDVTYWWVKWCENAVLNPKQRISILALSPDSRCFWCVRLNEKALCHSRTFCLKQAAGPYHLRSCPLVHIWRKNAVIPNHQIYYLSPWEYINHCPWMSAQWKPLSSPFTKPLPRLRQLLSYWYFQTFFTKSISMAYTSTWYAQVRSGLMVGLSDTHPWAVQCRLKFKFCILLSFVQVVLIGGIEWMNKKFQPKN